jgi:branched-chain amino acid transport system ATP-binding protein
MQMVRHIADWVVVMAEGRIVAEGAPDEVMANAAVIDAYLGSHQDVDLGVVTGRVEGKLTSAGEELAKFVQELDVAAGEIDLDGDGVADGIPGSKKTKKASS